MKTLVHILFLFLTVLLVSCGESNGQFKVEGRFLHINQGELYVYSPDGVIEGMDTIKIQDGRFAYEIPCENRGTLMIVFPNYLRQPIFAESGKAVKVKADASHLKEMEVTGSKDNELMTDFRQQTASVSPPEEVKFAEQFVKDHPESPVSLYLTRRYFLLNGKPDYAKAISLIDVMLKSQPQNGTLPRLKQQLASLAKVSKGNALPAFSATDVKGRRVTRADLAGENAVITVWATWSYESMEAQRLLVETLKRTGDRLKVVSICLDASPKECRRTMEGNNMTWPVICDGQMTESPLLQQLGLGTIPDNIILKNGRITERSLNTSTFRQRLTELSR